MASLQQLQSEPYWRREIVPDVLNQVFRDLCAHYKSNPAGGGTRGNEFHLYGRHRSLEWCANSQFCTNPAYGTRDTRDRSGNHQHIRAFDLPLSPPLMIAVSHFLDVAVRGGHAPMVAEWFGTFNNRTVSGWFEGGVSSADDSHLSHVHVGLWTKYADDAGALSDLFDIMTGAREMTPAELLGTKLGKSGPTVAVALQDVAALPEQVAELKAQLAELAAAVAALTPQPPVNTPTEVAVTGTLTLTPPE